jgi:hypothetical protein
MDCAPTEMSDSVKGSLFGSACAPTETSDSVKDSLFGSALSSNATTRGFSYASTGYATQKYMEKYSDRLETFKAYPVKPYHPRPSELAALGFYYIGPRDKVKCFSCNICVHNFEETDLVLNEHYRWSCGNCDYLKHIASFRK